MYLSFNSDLDMADFGVFITASVNLNYIMYQNVRRFGANMRR